MHNWPMKLNLLYFEVFGKEIPWFKTRNRAYRDKLKWRLGFI